MDYEAHIQNNPPAILSVVELSMFLSCSENMAREFVWRKEIPHRRVGGRIQIKLADAQQLKEKLNETGKIPR